MRHVLRGLRRSPGFTAVVVLTLALGIGANSAMFTVISAALAPLQIADPSRVVMLWTANASRGLARGVVSTGQYGAWRSSGVFSSLTIARLTSFNLRLGGRVERISGMSVSPEFFDALSSNTIRGRVFTAADVTGPDAGVAVIGEKLWRSRFGGDPKIAGRVAVINQRAFTILGVLPMSFPQLSDDQLYVPLYISPQDLTEHGGQAFFCYGRLRPHVTLDEARFRIDAVTARMAKEVPIEGGSTAVLETIDDAAFEDSAAILAALGGAAAFVLLIACANIANLVLTRGAARTREFTIRAALGAGRWQLARPLLAENLALAILGGLAAVPLAALLVRALVSFQLEELPSASDIALDWKLPLFHLALILAAGLFLGLLPAWQARRMNPHDALKSAGRHTASLGQRRLRGLFVAAEVALTFVLLTGAGILLANFARLRSTPPGYDPHSVFTAQLAIAESPKNNDRRQSAFWNAALEATALIPGVVSAGAVDSLPTNEGENLYLFQPDRPQPPIAQTPAVFANSVGGDYFRALRVPLLRGRYLDARDTRDSPKTAVIDQRAAARYWPNENPIGKMLELGSPDTPHQIVGVVGSVEPLLSTSLKSNPGRVFVPIAQSPSLRGALVVRSALAPGALTTALRDAVRRIDPDVPVFEAMSLDDARAASRATPRVTSFALAGFAALALALAAIGLYGVVAYHAGQRTREFSIRLALGARPTNVLRLVMTEAALWIGAGMAIGIPAAALAARALATSDLVTSGMGVMPALMGVAAILTAAVLAATLIPARRAMSTDPAITLREE